MHIRVEVDDRIWAHLGRLDALRIVVADVRLPLDERVKPSSWGTEGMVARRLLDGVDGMPVVVLCRDHPNSVTYVNSTEETDEEIAALYDEALVNLGKVQVQIEKLEVEADMDLYIVHGDYYAAEKILDEAFMHRMYARLGQVLLAVAIPNKGTMFVTGGAQSPKNLAG